MLEKITNFFGDKEKTASQLYDEEVQRMIDEASLINNELVTKTYPLNDRMYDSEKQWDEPIEGTANDRLAGYSKLVHNFIADIVDRWTMFIGANPPIFTVQSASENSISGDISPTETEQQVEEDEAEAIKKLILKCLKQKHNSWRTLFLRTVHTQSMYGRAMWFPHLESGIHYPIIELLRPHDSLPVFDSRDYQTALYIVHRKLVDRVAIAKQLGIDVRTLPIESDPLERNVITDRERVYQYRVLTPSEQVIFVGGKTYRRDPHGYKMVPVFLAQNRITPFSSEGKDDIGNSFSDQKAYNSAYSNLVDAAEDRVIGKRLIKKPGQSTDLQKLYDRMQRHVIIGMETEITDLHPDIQLRDIIESMNVIKQNIEDDSGITELLKGRFSGSIATGVALSGLSRGIEDIAKQKIVNISEMMEHTFNFMLFLLKKYRGADPETGISYSKIIKRDWYNFDFFWDNMSIQDERTLASTMIDLKNAKLISGMSAMKRMRVQYPEDEETKIAYETMNPLLNPELALQMAQQDLQNQGFSPEQEHMNAKRENSKLLAGIDQPVNETNPGQHAIHLQDHKEVLKMARGKGRTLLQKHISAHEAGLNSQPASAPKTPGTPTPQPSTMSNPVGAPRPMATENVPNPQTLV